MKTFAQVFLFGALTVAAFAQGDPAKGKAVFIKQNCARCHGTDGQGGAGARLAPNPRPVDYFIRYVRKPAGGMPAYTNQVTDAELTDVRAYLATVPAPPAVKDVPLLNQ